MQPQRHNRGFTLVEMLTVMGIIGLLLAILLPALGTAARNAEWAASQNNMRQTFTLMQAYSSDNREFIVPSLFDFTTSPYPGKTRSADPIEGTPRLGGANQGTWADILWTTQKLGPMPLMDGTINTYRYDSPDRFVYEAQPGYDQSPLRSGVAMSKTFRRNNVPDECKPFGGGATDLEIGQPGYFAANNFFDSRASAGGSWRTTGQIRRPQDSMYLVDSLAGEVIEDSSTPFATDTPTFEVDLRYLGNSALFLLLDGHVQTEGEWSDITELQGPFTGGTPTWGPNGRSVRITNLDRADNPDPGP